MIIHRLILQHLGHRDDTEFYRLQARDAIGWLESNGVRLDGSVSALDLGCGHGILGAELLRQGCQVTFADESNGLQPGLESVPFRRIDIDRDDLATLGAYDLVICSNVFEHLARPEQFLGTVARLLKPAGHLYLSWTNWLSPWGGHEFSPFHFLGPTRGHRLYDRLFSRPRVHTPFINLFPTYVGRTLRLVRRQPDLRLLKAVPRYYPELAFLIRLPLVREFLTWNCALLLERVSPAS